MEATIKREETNKLDDTKKFAEVYASLPAEKKALVIAFMNGMEVQRSIEEPKRA